MCSISTARVSPQCSLDLKESGPLTFLQLSRHPANAFCYLLLLPVYSTATIVPFLLLLLAPFLAYELSKGADSFWISYLGSLPGSNTRLSSFSAKEGEQLQVRHASA